EPAEHLPEILHCMLVHVTGRPDLSRKQFGICRTRIITGNCYGAVMQSLNLLPHKSVFAARLVFPPERPKFRYVIPGHASGRFSESVFVSACSGVGRVIDVRSFLGDDCQALFAYATYDITW